MKKNAKKVMEIYNELKQIPWEDLKRVSDFKESDFNKYVMIGFLPGHPIDKMIGRVVQVRKEVGAFGSDRLFIREFDGRLMCHENQWFFLIPEEEYKERLDAVFCEYDEPNMEYSLNGKDKMSGFVIDSPIKEGETTPM